ncbi:ABC transporter ATP-binding protein [Paenibacillus validus]|uniref:ATP-binding cassette domain-containing protein n=1 Tax=Paenibacillus validus TaxID=44253 RepID=A0A7X2Z7T7_9BACL|nr:ABC transporter ATP-binding protein [Paenibacillus validus]MUG69913.1 ATP-binding cassette domain-containing protein [Paenibacillus validus]
MTYLEVKDAMKRFGGLQAVNNVSFSIKKGTIFSMIGPNGSGKTTLLNLITGFLPLTGGKIRFEGREISGKAPFQIAHLGIIRTFQNGSIVKDATVLDNVMIGAYRYTKSGFWTGGFSTPNSRKEEKWIREKAKEVLKIVGLEQIANQPASTLPFGYQRLIEVARVLLSEPKVMLLDEPAAGLNDAESLRLGEAIKTINRELGITTILVEHHMGVVMEVSDQIIVLNNGERIAEGIAREISQNPQVIEVYLGRESVGA